MGPLRFLLAHHPPGELHDKCYLLAVGPLRLYLCSRCLGLYPLLLLVLAWDIASPLPLGLYPRALLFWATALPGWYHWAKEHTRGRPWGSKLLRSLTGLAAAPGAALLLGGHFRTPYNFPFLFSLLLLATLTGTTLFLTSFFHEPQLLEDPLHGGSKVPSEGGDTPEQGGDVNYPTPTEREIEL